MDIQEIKSRLTLSEVIKHYGFKSDKHNRINCPFHDDKNPSMQLYWKSHTAYCFSGNCKTHGKSLDVIDFVMHKENCTKHEAIGKCKAMIGGTALQPISVEGLTKAAILTKMFTYFKNAVHNSKPAQEYIKQRGLDFTRLEIGYNTGQFHHGTRKDEGLIEACLKVGLLSKYERLSRTGETSYKPFAKYAIVFALRNRSGQVTGLYFRSTVNDKEQKHFYLKERSGIYPGYPKEDTEKLIITEAVIDAATLLQIKAITDHYSIVTAFGTNGLNEEVKTAIKELKNLSEIIFAFDNDEAGNKAAEKYSKELKALLPNLILSKLILPEGEDINSTAAAHQSEIFTHLLETRLFFSTENINQKPVETKKAVNEVTVKSTVTEAKKQNELDTKNPYKISYRAETASYYIQGGVSKVMDSMRVTLVVEHPVNLQKSRNKVDLYEDKQVEKTAKEVAEKLSLRKDLLEADLYKLTDLLDHYRETHLLENKGSNEPGDIIYPLTTQERGQIETLLKKPKLIEKITELLGKAGIVGEEKNRIFLLLIAISYKMPETLHALIQGSSGSGKTRLLKQISDCIPGEKVTKLTRISDKVLYNYPERYFVNRLLCLEDIDGLSEEAEFAFRELQSNGELNSATSIKLDNGQITSGQKTVKGPIASLACTTRGEIYEDNMSRVFLIAVDESTQQTRRIISYQNSKAAGQIDYKKEAAVRKFIQNLVRMLAPFDVINPFAEKISLPEEAHKIRRLNDLFQSFIKQITIINQYQRKKNEQGNLITELEDVETAIEIMFESIVLKVDELDGSLRQFFEKLKTFIGKKSRQYEFTRFEVREATGLGKTQQHHYISKLLEMEYIQQYGFANRGFKYKIVHWDNYTALRDKIKAHLQNQLSKLKTEHQTNASRTPKQTVSKDKSLVNQE